LFYSGSLFKYDSSVAFWNFCAVGNYAARFYKYAMFDVRAVQTKLEDDAAEAVADFEKKILKQINKAATGDLIAEGQSWVADSITEFVKDQADTVLTAWQDLLPHIITRYHDGYRAENLTAVNINMYKLFYPGFWLNNVGFFNTHKNSDPKSLLFAALPSSSTAGIMVTVLLTSCLAFGAGMLFQRKLVSSQRSLYLPIEENL
jgi:hypothetical protein